MVKFANEQVDKLVPDRPRHSDRPEQSQLDRVGRPHGAAGQPAVDTRHSRLRRQLMPEPVARIRGDYARHGVRSKDRRHDDEGVRLHLRDQRRRYPRHGRQQLQSSPSPPRYVAELQLVADVRYVTGRQSVVRDAGGCRIPALGQRTARPVKYSPNLPGNSLPTSLRGLRKVEIT